MRKPKPLLTYEAVKEKALRLLEFRSHSEYELRNKLYMAQAKEEHIDTVISFCKEYGFINDFAYATHKANDLVNLKKFGIRRVRSELKAKGIADYIIDEVTENLNKESEKENLLPLIAKKLKGDFSDKNKDKCLRYFIYRGYDLYDIKNTIELIEEGFESDNEL